MFSGKGGIAYSIMKTVLYMMGYWEYLSFGRHENRSMQIIVASLIVANGFIRQLYIYERHNLHRKVDISMTEKENMLNTNISGNRRGCTHIKEGYGLKGISERIKGLERMHKNLLISFD